MPRIPKQELDNLKRTISLAAVAESQGHQLRKQGKDLVLLCPFHQESTPPVLSLLRKTSITALAAGRRVRSWTG